MSRVSVTIDRLLLTGFEPADRTALLEGLQSELSRVLADSAAGGEWARSRRTPVLRLRPLPFEPGRAGGRKFGQGLARAVSRSLKP